MCGVTCDAYVASLFLLPYALCHGRRIHGYDRAGAAARCAFNTVCVAIPLLDEAGKTRTKDKYRVVYSDHQRLELEKEFHYSRYITIRRKAELASMLGLSERQVKIWFQNRRAKDRKQAKKQEEMLHRELVKAEPVPTATLPPFLSGGGAHRWLLIVTRTLVDTLLPLLRGRPSSTYGFV
ncbi:hypothetical protein MTO96_002540 [Rhipicephalus appendiculatus]